MSTTEPSWGVVRIELASAVYVKTLRRRLLPLLEPLHLMEQLSMVLSKVPVLQQAPPLILVEAKGKLRFPMKRNNGEGTIGHLQIAQASEVVSPGNSVCSAGFFWMTASVVTGNLTVRTLGL